MERKTQKDIHNRLRSVGGALRAFIAGWLVPDMSWIADWVKPLALAVAAGIVVHYILSLSLSKQKYLRLSRNQLIMFACIVAFGITNIVALRAYQGAEYSMQLQQATDAIVSDLNQFYTQRTVQAPQIPFKPDSPNVILETDDPYVLAKDSYDRQTALLYVINYRQRVISIGNALYQSGVITDKEFNQVNLFASGEYVTYIEWLLELLQDFDMRMR